MIECTRCASRNAADDVFCGSCGAYLHWAESPAWTRPVVVTVPVVVETPSLEPAPVYRPLSTRVEDSHGRVCQVCARINAWERRFCARCGNRLIHGDDILHATLSTETVIAPWWQRIAFRRWPRGDRVHPAGTRPGPRRSWAPKPLPELDLDAGPLARVWHRVRSTTRRVWPDVLLGLLVVVLICLLMPSLTHRVYDAVRNRATQPPTVHPVSCGEPAARANLLPAFPASFVCDGQANTAWVTPLDPRYTPPQLVITLATTDPATGLPAPGVDVAGFRMTAAVPPAEYVVPGTGRPSKLRLDLYATNKVDGATPVRSLTIPGDTGRDRLVDNSATQSWSIGPCLAGIRVVVVTVLATYPDPATHQPATDVFVNKVALYGPRSACTKK